MKKTLVYISHRGPGKTYHSAGVRWESNTWVTCLWETINAALLGSPEFLHCKSPRSLILSYHVTLWYERRFLISTRLLLKNSQPLSPNSYMWISMSNKLQQTNIFTLGKKMPFFLHRFGSHMKPHDNCICFLSVLSFPFLYSGQRTVWKEHREHSHPVHWLHIRVYPPSWTLTFFGASL